MASTAKPAARDLDRLLKSLLVLSRSVQQILEVEAVETAVKKPLSFSKVQILRLLKQKESQTASQVARFLGVSKPAVTQIIDSMVREKRVSRRTSPTSRREVALRLTAKGEKEYQALKQRQRHLLRLASRQRRGRRIEPWIESLWEISRALTQADRTFQHVCLQCGAHADGSCVLAGGGLDCLFLLERDKPPKTRSTATTKRRASARSR